jgi:hypothetical protein
LVDAFSLSKEPIMPSARPSSFISPAARAAQRTSMTLRPVFANSSKAFLSAGSPRLSRNAAMSLIIDSRVLSSRSE